MTDKIIFFTWSINFFFNKMLLNTEKCPSQFARAGHGLFKCLQNPRILNSRQKKATNPHIWQNGTRCLLLEMWQKWLQDYRNICRLMWHWSTDQQIISAWLTSLRFFFSLSGSWWPFTAISNGKAQDYNIEMATKLERGMYWKEYFI